MILAPRRTSVETPEEVQKRKRERKKLLSFNEIVNRLDGLKALGKIRLHHLFDDEEIHQVCDTLNIEFRERVFTPAKTLGLFVSQVLSRGDACITVMSRFNRERKDSGLSSVSDDASAYTKARARLPLKLINHLSDDVRKIGHTMTPNDWKWHGLNAYLVDGFVLRAPDTFANQERYPQPSSQKEGFGFPQVRVVTTTSLADGCVVHHNTAAVEGKKTGEVSLFREKHKNFKKGDIRSYKSSMGMCELRCLTPDNLDREIAVAVLGYNLVRVLMCDTAAVLEVHPREISFSAARDAWLAFHDERETVNDVAWMIHSAAPHFVRNRPGRDEPRAVKRRNAKYPKLKEPRPSHRSQRKKKTDPEITPQNA